MEILEFLHEYKKNHPQFLSLALFGSRAKGEAKPTSDIDIAFIIDTKELHSPWDYFNTLQELKEEIHRHFGLHCDLFDLTSEAFTPKEIIYV